MVTILVAYKYRDVMFCDSVHYNLAQTISCDSRQCISYRCSSLLWSSVCTFWFSVLQRRLGFLLIVFNGGPGYVLLWLAVMYNF